MRPRDFIGLGAFWLLLAIASLAGWLGLFDGQLFDLAVRTVSTNPPATVAVVRVDQDHPMPADALRQAGATRVVGIAPGDVEALQRAGRFAAASGCRPPAPDGVLRVLRLRDDAGRPCPLARLAVAAGLDVPDARLLSPDFSARTSTSIPRIDAHSAPGPAGLGTALKGRIVLLVPAPDAAAHVTPLYRADGLLEPSIPYAMALDALARGRAIRWAPPGVDVLAAMLVALLLHLGLRRATYRVTLSVTLLATVPVLLATGAMLHLARLYIPATASLVAMAAFALLSILRRNRALADTLVDVDHRLTGLVGQPLGNRFELVPDLAWEHANRFVIEFFDLRRSLMLELPTGATHLRAVAAFGCTADDIIEKRRDYRRAPYSTALARELPTPPSRPFLPHVEGVVDLITPLMAAEQLVGFWAFSVVPTPGSSLDVLAAEAGRYAREVAKIILRAGDLNAPVERSARRWPTLARLRSRLLDGANQAREQLAAYRDVFAAVGLPIAVCDLLGHVQFANPAFEQFSAAIDQPLMVMSATGLLVHQCGLSPADAKEAMRRAMLGTGEEVRLPMRARGHELPQALVLRPILRRGPDLGASAVSPFDLLGMILEIVPDVSGAEAATRFGHAAAQYARRSQAMLDSIARTVDSLGAKEASQERLADIVATGLDDARTLLHQAEVPPGHEHDVPERVELRLVLQQARHVHARESREKGVDIQLPASALPAVAADPEQIANLLRGLLGLLLDDAAPGSAVVVDSPALRGSSVQLWISNDGYGMPAWHVQDVLRDGADIPLLPDASLLDQVAHAAAALDGRVAFQLEADLGKGYRATVTLPRAY